MEKEKKVRVYFRDLEVPHTWLIGSERFGYEFYPSGIPEGFLKMYFGSKTILIPIADILMIEMDV